MCVRTLSCGSAARGVEPLFEKILALIANALRTQPFFQHAKNTAFFEKRHLHGCSKQERFRLTQALLVI